MTSEIFYNISKIIERDSKSTTYKYALLRGTISIIQDNSPYIKIEEGRAYMPTGLLIEKWLLYYYPIFESKIQIPQIHGDANLAFIKPFREMITEYESRGGFSAFYNDLKVKDVPVDLQHIFFELIKKLRTTITTMPMKYIGRSLSDEFYSIYSYKNHTLRRNSVNDVETLIKHSGVFSIPVDYYEAFKILGSFVTGQDSILFRWAEFSVNASSQGLTVDRVLNDVLKKPIEEREISASRKIYMDILQREGNVYCVWTGRRLTNYHIDHMIPFSVWKNNDLWNLLPSDARINGKKLDKIPSPAIIEKQKDLILNYWGIIAENLPKRFQKEIQVALLGNQPFNTWRDQGIKQLQSSCNYLIENRGFEGWEI